MAFTAKILSWRFSPPEYCRLCAQKKAYQGGVTGTPGPPPSYAPVVWFFAIKINGYRFLNNRRTKNWHSHSIKNEADTYFFECCKRFPVILILYILCPALVKICSSSQRRVKTVKNIFLVFFMNFFFEIKQILNIHPETGARVNVDYPPHGTCGEDSSSRG